MERVVAATSAHMTLSRDPKTGKEPTIEDCATICGASGTAVSVSRMNPFAPLQVDSTTDQAAKKVA